MKDKREVVEGKQIVGAGEEIVFVVSGLTLADGVGSAFAYDESDGDADVSGSVLSGSAALLDGSLTFKKFSGGTPHHTYRLVQQYTAGSNVLECIVKVTVKP